MNVYDKAHELAKAMKDSEDLGALKLAFQNIKKDPEASQMLDGFQQKQQHLQEKMMQGEEPEEEELQQMQKLFEVISMNPMISKLFEAEKRVQAMMQDIQKIVADPIQEIYQK